MVEMISVDQNFLQAVDFVLQEEGGTNYAIRHIDRGGLTKYGISSRQYPDIDIENLTKDDAIAIYYTDYWSPCQCGLLEKPVAMVIFDSAVNCGQPSASVWLQKSINYGSGAPLLEIDGWIGPKTVAKASSCSPYSLTLEIVSHRLTRYHRIIGRSSEQAVMAGGWMGRVARLIHLVSFMPCT